MPDWVTHLAVAWTLCRILRFRFKIFSPENTMIVMVGALIPDMVKLALGLKFLGMDVWDYLEAVHLPVGSLIVAGMMALLFPERRNTFLFLSLGVATHYCLDLILLHLAGGMYLLFPFNWNYWQLGLTTSADYHVTLVAVLIAVVVYLVGRLWDKKAIKTE
ncbi:metal-dependent hydrolase [Methanobacterium congolense]|jgi:hypothetical protein|uniref:Membrane-bound metal-dependent hydrolase n=1 Tax=Methanobacterium congolense TaxID=118062 RepID=A0A1D3L2F0_9EURY|nr:metal-dependent hydrolase [Methanobacterium congolense]SCG85842.1 putative protein [Methanobacterium congolense]